MQDPYLPDGCSQSDIDRYFGDYPEAKDEDEYDGPDEHLCYECDMPKRHCRCAPLWSVQDKLEEEAEFKLMNPELPFPEPEDDDDEIPF